MEKTKEEILTSNIKTDKAYWLGEGYLKSWYPEINEGILKAMEEYGKQQRALGFEEGVKSKSGK